MTVYIDFILFLNFAFDLILLFTTSISLKRNAPPIRLILSAFVGSLSTLLLFFKINSLELFLFKIVLSIIMILIAFGKKNIKYFMINIMTFYLVSIFLGGFLYLLNIQFSYKHEGIIFYHKNISINIILLLVMSPIIMYIYIKQTKLYQKKIKNYYKVNIKIGKKELKLNGYLDTGNNLTYKGKPVILTNIKNTFKKNKILVPYTVINGVGVLECINVKAEIPTLGTYDVLLGFTKTIKLSGIDVLLNNQMEEKHVTKNKTNNKNFSRRR